MIGDMPTISDASHAHTVYGLGNLAVPMGTIAGTTNQALGANTPLGGLQNTGLAVGFAPRRVAVVEPHVNAKQERPAMPSRRLVQVFIADPDENVPLERSMLYSGEQKLTDATDQELFFEIDIKSALEKHNEVRVKWVNKKVKERTEYLEPAKIRDLKMVVVNVATF